MAAKGHTFCKVLIGLMTEPFQSESGVFDANNNGVNIKNKKIQKHMHFE